MTHAFEVEDAKKYGVDAAIILNSMRYWIALNRANGRNLHDGKTWMYNSVSAWQKLFSYLSVQSLRTAIGKLKESGVIITGNYNEKAYDKTTWYAFVDEIGQIGKDPLLKSTEGPESLMQNQQMDSLKSTNGSVENNKPIPILTNSNQIKERESAQASEPSGAPAVARKAEDFTADMVHSGIRAAINSTPGEDLSEGFVERGAPFAVAAFSELRGKLRRSG